MATTTLRILIPILILIKLLGRIRLLHRPPPLHLSLPPLPLPTLVPPTPGLGKVQVDWGRTAAAFTLNPHILILLPEKARL